MRSNEATWSSRATDLQVFEPIRCQRSIVSKYWKQLISDTYFPVIYSAIPGTVYSSPKSATTPGHPHLVRYTVPGILRADPDRQIRPRTKRAQDAPQFRLGKGPGRSFHRRAGPLPGRAGGIVSIIGPGSIRIRSRDWLTGLNAAPIVRNAAPAACAVLHLLVEFFELMQVTQVDHVAGEFCPVGPARIADHDLDVVARMLIDKA